MQCMSYLLLALIITLTAKLTSSNLSSVLNFCSDFRRKRNIYARCFFIQSIFADRKIVFVKIFFYPIEDIDFLSSNFKIYFNSDYYL